jgi:chromosomal replication initiator protein
MVLYIIPGVNLPMVQVAPPVDPNHVIKTVFDYFGVPLSQVKGRCRKREYAQARQVAMYLLRQKTDLTLRKVGKLFERDYTTVICSEQVVEGFLKVEKPFQAKMTEIQKLLRN